MLVRFFYFMFLALLLSCGSCTSGNGGEWLKGEKLSVKGTIISMGSAIEPGFEVRNDSNEEIRVTPFKLEATFEKSGGRMATFDGVNGEPIVLKPGESFRVPPGIAPSASNIDRLLESQISMGPENGIEHAVFTINFK